MSKEIISVVELSDSHVKFLQSKIIRGKKAVTVCDLRMLQNFTDDEVGRLVRDVTAARPIPRNSLVAVIPRRLVIFKLLKLPSIQDSEIRKMTGLQLVQQIPYNLDDVAFEPVVLERDVSGYSKVLAIIVHKEVIERYSKIFKVLGLPLYKLTISSLGLAAWVEYQSEQKKIPAQQPVMVVNIDSVSSEIAFCHNQRILFSRSVAYGAKDLSSENLAGLLTQLDLSLSTYRKEDMGPEIQKVILISSFEETEVLKAKVEQQLKLTTEIYSSTANIVFQKSINLRTLHDPSGASWTNVAGLGTSSLKKIVNFLPEDFHASQQSKAFLQQWARFVLSLVAAVILSAGIWAIDIVQKNKELVLVEAELKKVKQEADEAQKKIQFVEFFKDKVSKQFFVADVMEEIYNLAPSDISIRSLDMDDKGALTIQGYAEAGGSVNNFQNNLLRTPRFKQVNLQFATKRRIFNMELTDFKIVCQLSFSSGEQP